ncbi:MULTISPECIES: nitroreductase family protein [Paenibacillus]|jgi:predicted oxidoreductase (fatty acid repression mutant protein)|uniref:Nitroreductase n=2 Tax=Paenibacillus TaxID=44249 RepID=A0A1R1EPS8_9BACL|nr:MULTISPECIES: nitroreductase family protein [Paenibacillus]MBJ9992672.1 nitroreductase family protein [Paenibacillus sp. S28]OMF53798.1 nitroreductase [Paenibacillus rhizosphaerae]OXL84320.1 nitroreductase [Paenibacillus sp. SSG-1]PQP90634.1 nitroreductase [Paenibacillus sp. AR247]UYO02135.1 nitroreductase family protein [Paenibacillus sp. PSB04]
MPKDFIEALKRRRSIYTISKQNVTTDERIQEIVEDAVKHAPSSFNSQTSRAVVLLGSNHDRLWDITEDILREVVNNPEAFKSTEQKIGSFRSGYGTVLFYEDMDVVRKFQDQFAAYSENFPIWSNQTSGMVQLIVWTALELEGFGASLQHYNPLIDERVRGEWNLPESWKLIAQMPFGKPTAPAGDKEFQPIAERVKVVR